MKRQEKNYKTIKMKMYQALYCSCVYESAYETLSIHRTKKGAEKAVEAHKNKLKKEHNLMQKRFKRHGMPKAEHSWDVHQGWDISEIELMD